MTFSKNMLHEKRDGYWNTKIKLGVMEKKVILGVALFEMIVKD